MFYDEDTTPPIVSSISPEDGTTDVAVETAITATFSEAMDSSTITTASFTLSGSAVSGIVTYDSDTYTATFTPDADLEYNHEYTATLTTAITDLAGNPLTEARTWSFTTIQLAWESYKTDARTEVWGTNSTTQYNDSYHIAYMKGEGFTANYTYTIGYYDGSGAQANSTECASSNATGVLDGVYDLTTDSSAAAGTWHSVVLDTTGSIPDTYAGAVASGDYVAEDDFIVDASAIGVEIIPLPGQANAPTDPDMDGLYEDLNGNGALDFNDVVLFFTYMEWIEVNEPISRFDFNGNTCIDFDDLVQLFDMT